MQKRLRAGNSLYARLSLVFGLLVAVPLAVSGLVLTLVARNSVLNSGDAMSRIGTDAVMHTSERLVSAVTKNLDQVTDQVSDAAQRSLKNASDRHIKTSDHAVSEATDQLIRNGQGVFAQAARESAFVGEQRVRQAGSQLRDLHRDSLKYLTGQFVKRTETELTNSAEPVRRRVKRAILEFTYAVNEEKVSAVVLAAQNGLSELEHSLASVARRTDIQEFFSEQAVEQLRRLMRVNPRALVPSHLVLISNLGGEVLRLPEDDTPPANPPSWTDRPEWKSVQDTREFVVLGLRTDASGAPVLRLVEQVKPAVEGERGMGAIVADVPLNNVTEIAAGQENQAASMLLVTGDGLILSSRDEKQVGKEIPSVRDPLAQPRRSVISPFQFSYTGLTGQNNLAVAKEWTPGSPPDTARIYGLVTLPEKVALRPLNDLEGNVTGAWQGALKKVKESGDPLIKSRLDAIRPEQDRIAKKAAASIEQSIRGLGDRVPAQLKGARDTIIHQSGAAIAQQTRAAADETDRQITRAKLDTVGAAKRNVTATARYGAAASVEEMRVATGREANLGARSMILNSAVLILTFVALALCLAIATSRSIVSPVNRLVRGTQALAAGDYGQRIRVEGEDELARLARAFNEMAIAIELGQAELRRSHDSLMAQKQRMQTIVDSSPDGLILLEPDGRISFMNPAAREMLMPKARSLPAPLVPVTSLPEPAQSWLRECLASIEVGGPAAEIALEAPTRRVLQYRGVAIAGEEPARPGLLLHLHDITRERQIDEMKSDFISLVSHELRTPLTSILGFSSYLLTGKLGEVTEPQQRALESVHRQAKRLSAIITDFLDVSRIESGRIEMRKEPVTVDSVARRVAADLQPQAGEKSITVSTRVPEAEDHVVAMGDEARISQVFTNLLGNAIKFTDPQGNIDVTIARRNGEVVCEVADSGCGIPPDELEKVFDRFYQVEKVVTRKSGGTGLGLAIVKNIVEAHGGRVWIESTFGKGTEVTFTLPAAE